MFDFEYYAPTKVLFGKDAESQVGHLVKAAGGTKVLLHFGRGEYVRPLVEKARVALAADGIDCVELDGVVPNPHLSLVYKGIDVVCSEGVDFLLALGGGSVIDSAKAIAYGAANEGDVWDFFEGKRRASACLPVGCVLTIAAAGSEMSNSCVITKDDGGAKRPYDDDLARPRFAVMNPELTMTLPPYQTACGCTDIMMHTMERYFTQGGNMEITDALAEALLRTVAEQALVLRDDPTNYDARAEVMWEGSLAHNGLTGCGNDGGDFASHMLEHEMGGMFDVAHGAGLAAIWGSWARYVYRDCLPRFKKFAMNVWGIVDAGNDGATALAGIEAQEDFYRKIGMPTNFAELGVDVTDEQIAEMAHSCSLATGGVAGSAKKLRESDMVAIYRAARGR